MSQISRVVTQWTGSPVVGGGVTVMHCTVGGEHGLMSAYRSFLDTIKASFPTGLQWTFPPAGPIITQENGELADAWVDGSPVAPLAPTALGTWVNGVGIRVKWTTGAFYGGRAVVGSTFLLPVLSGSFEGAGNILNGTISDVQTAATTFVAAAGLRIYCRPRPGLVGQSFAVNGAVVPDQVSWLRGRRT